MQQILYPSIDFEEIEDNYIEDATIAMNKIYEEYDVLAIKKHFEMHYAKIYNTFYNSLC